VGGEAVGEIGRGLVIFLGVRSGDREDDARLLAKKIAHLRIFPDGAGKLNRSLLDIGGEALSVSFLPHAIASAEGLAKIGPPAVPMLLEVVTKGGDLERLYAYASLGWIQDDRAFATLLGALERDRSLGDVVAMALADHGRPGAIASLYEAYQTGEPWQRMEFEDTIRRLHWGDQAEPLWTMDWRLRYRTLAHLGTFDIGWIGVIATVHERAGVTRTRPVVPVRALEEITTDLPDRPAPLELCDDCGEPIQLPTGVPACPETALNVARYQLDVLNLAREEGIEDLFDLLDEVEADEWEQHAEGEPSDPAERAAWRDERDEMKVQLLTCRWLIEQGAESVGAGKAVLLAEALRLADRYGDPDGLFRPAVTLRRASPKVGRNDPCPCGSGRKYKHCCLGKRV